MSKIILNFDDTTGQVTSSGGVYVGTLQGSAPVYVPEDAAPGNTVDKLVTLRNAGFTTEEIIQLDQRGMI